MQVEFYGTKPSVIAAFIGALVATIAYGFVIACWIHHPGESIRGFLVGMLLHNWVHQINDFAFQFGFYRRYYLPRRQVVHTFKPASDAELEQWREKWKVLHGGRSTDQ